MTWVVGLGLALMGVGIAAIWTRDIVAGEQVDLSNGFFGAREPSGSLLWPHWLAEYATAATLVVGGIAVIVDASWARVVAAIGAGALLVFSYLVQPALFGFLVAARLRSVMLASMIAGFVATVAGVFLSVLFDLPTGPTIVAASAVFVLAGLAVRRLRRRHA